MKKFMVAVSVACLCVLACVGLFACASAPVEKSSDSESFSAEAEDKIEEKVIPSSDPFYVLIVGSDSRQGTVEINQEYYSDGIGRSDTMMLARVDPQSHLVTLVSIPRDTEVYANDTVYKINDFYYQKGIEGALEQTEALTGVKPAYYLVTTFVGFETFVDAINGVDVEVPIEMSLQDIVHGDQITLSAGWQTLNGPQALVLARVRKAFNDRYPDPEALRQRDDRNIITAFLNKVVGGNIPSDVALAALFANCETNFDKDTLEYYVNDFVAHADSFTVYSGTGPYTGAFTDSGWLVPRDEGKWAEVIAAVDAGRDPNEVVASPTL